jgi:hypothetical protein
VSNEIGAALIGAGVAAVGWVVANITQRRTKTLEERRDFLREQMEEFYGPLLAYVQRKQWLQQVQDRRMLTVPAGDEWVRALQFFMDKQIVPTMQAIEELLMKRSYLSEDWPQSFSQFMEHSAQSIALYKLWRDTNIPGDVQAIPWPTQLECDVRERKERLEAQFKQLYRDSVSSQ